MRAAAKPTNGETAPAPHEVVHAATAALADALRAVSPQWHQPMIRRVLEALHEVDPTAHFVDARPNGDISNHEAEEAILAHHTEPGGEFPDRRPIGDLLVAMLGAAPLADDDGYYTQDGSEFAIHALEDIADQVTATATWLYGSDRFQASNEQAVKALMRIAKRARFSAEIWDRLSRARAELWAEEEAEQAEVTS